MLNEISVITISYNNLKELIQTILSVDLQHEKPFEHLIIDGSTNGEIAQYLQATHQPAYRKWVCEADKGIADAFNKGILKSAGNIIVLLNAGDTFFNADVITTVSKIFSTNTNILWLHGKYMLLRGGQQVIIGKPFDRRKLYRGMRSICHQTMFVKKEAYEKYGMYDENEKIAMDYDFLCRIANEPFLFLNHPIVKYAPGGISGTEYEASLKANKNIYEKHYGKSVRLNIWQARLRFLHALLQSPAGNILYKIKTNLGLENM